MISRISFSPLYPTKSYIPSFSFLTNLDPCCQLVRDSTYFFLLMIKSQSQKKRGYVHAFHDEVEMPNVDSISWDTSLQGNVTCIQTVIWFLSSLAASEWVDNRSNSNTLTSICGAKKNAWLRIIRSHATRNIESSWIDINEKDHLNVPFYLHGS